MKNPSNCRICFIATFMCTFLFCKNLLTVHSLGLYKASSHLCRCNRVGLQTLTAAGLPLLRPLLLLLRLSALAVVGSGPGLGCALRAPGHPGLPRPATPELACALLPVVSFAHMPAPLFHQTSLGNSHSEVVLRISR